MKIPIMFHETFILDSNVFVYTLKLGKEKLFKINQKNIKYQISVIQCSQIPLLSTCTLLTNTGSYLNILTKERLRLRQSG